MMPCQEPPVAMATWQATITVPEGCLAISSGDIVECKNNVLRKSNTGKGQCSVSIVQFTSLYVFPAKFLQFY